MNDMAKDYAEDLRDFAAIAEREGYGTVALAPATLRDLAAELDRLCAVNDAMQEAIHRLTLRVRAAPPVARSGDS